ncbi:AAA family ATPase [Biomaibacter acetigenes]|uniref:AAA family ATPase n=1 Tax=Biomaibacter acetigenes TaxID=2316383 RepID=UPI0013CE8571|nr:AAA family ATPase [Biomaibacter acetigenes]
MSPSGHGLHILAKVQDKSRLPSGRKSGNIEVYTADRYFTITGNHLKGTSTEIYDRQAELESFVRELFDAQNESLTTELGPIPSDTEVQALVKAADQVVPDIHHLLYGHWFEARTDGIDRSGMEYLLARKLVEFGFKDLETVAKIVYGSAVHRAKTAGRSPAASWKLAVDCARHALERGTAVSYTEAERDGNWLLAQAVNYEDWLNQVPDAEPLWEGILYRGAVHLLAAPSKRGKSRFIHDLLAHLTWLPEQLVVNGKTLADGKYWNMKHKHHLKVLVITEEPQAAWRTRNIPLSNVKVISAYTARSGGVKPIAEVISSNIFDVIILDVLDKIIPITDENDNAEIVEKLAPILEATHNSTTCVVLVHHFRKSGGTDGDEIRGGTGLLGSVDVYIKFANVTDEKNARKLEVIGRLDHPEEPLYAVLNDIKHGTYELPQENAACQKDTPDGSTGEKIVLFLKTSKKPASPKDISTALNLTEAAVKKALARLVGKKLVERIGRGKYKVVEK